MEEAISLKKVWDFVTAPVQLATRAIKALSKKIAGIWHNTTVGLGTRIPSVWKAAHLVVSAITAVILTTVWPLLCVGLVVAGATRHVKGDYMKVILVFLVGAVAYGLLFSGIFIAGDILFIFTTMVVMDMLSLWGKRIREVASEEVVTAI